MDGKRFDAIAKVVAGNSRRSLLKAGLSVVIGGVSGAVSLGQAEAAQVPRAPGQICRKHLDCASGVCGPRDRYGRSRCLCASPADCPQPNAGDACRIVNCSVAGVCEMTVNVGASCDDGNLCTVNATCQANATCTGTPKNCDDGNACTIDTCDPDTGACVHTAISCDDNNACTVDTCDPEAGCVHTAIACGTVSDGNGGTICCGGCSGETPCCTNGTCGSCPACVCPHGPTTITLADGSILGINGGAVCISPCTSNADCACGQLCVASYQLCLDGTPTTDCTSSSRPAGSYCASLGICSVG